MRVNWVGGYRRRSALVFDTRLDSELVSWINISIYLLVTCKKSCVGCCVEIWIFSVLTTRNFRHRVCILVLRSNVEDMARFAT